MMRRFFAIAFAAFALGVGGVPAQAQVKSITVFAAASMKNALDDINAASHRASHPTESSMKVVVEPQR